MDSVKSIALKSILKSQLPELPDFSNLPNYQQYLPEFLSHPSKELNSQAVVSSRKISFEDENEKKEEKSDKKKGKCNFLCLLRL